MQLYIEPLVLWIRCCLCLSVPVPGSAHVEMLNGLDALGLFLFPN